MAETEEIYGKLHRPMTFMAGYALITCLAVGFDIYPADHS